MEGEGGELAFINSLKINQQQSQHIDYVKF